MSIIESNIVRYFIHISFLFEIDSIVIVCFLVFFLEFICISSQFHAFEIFCVTNVDIEFRFLNHKSLFNHFIIVRNSWYSFSQSIFSLYRLFITWKIKNRIFFIKQIAVNSFSFFWYFLDHDFLIVFNISSIITYRCSKFFDKFQHSRWRAHRYRVQRCVFRNRHEWNARRRAHEQCIYRRADWYLIWIRHWFKRDRRIFVEIWTCIDIEFRQWKIIITRTWRHASKQSQNNF